MMRILIIFCLIAISACAPIRSSFNSTPKDVSVVVPTYIQENAVKKKVVEDFTIESLYNPSFDVDGYLFDEQELVLNYEYVIKSNKYDIPPVITPRVRYYLDMYTKKYPASFQNFLERSNKYIYLVKDILKREGLPLQLAILPFAESGYNTDAYSYVGAGGMWQFMPSTGKIYGLDINYWVDERRDFEKSTIAAAKHLKYLYENLGDWYLAIAAYNAGFYKVYYGTKKYNTKDFFKLAEKRYLKYETKDYVPKFIALSIIYYNYIQYGFDSPSSSPLFYEKINLKQPVNLYVIADLINTDIETLKELNPDLKKPITPPNDEYNLKVPYGTKSFLKEKIAKMSPKELLKVKIYKAKQGEYVKNIANRFQSNIDDIMKVNGLKYSRILYDTYLFIPESGFMQTAFANDFIQDVKIYAPKVHIVKSGESLYTIAHKYGLTLNDVIKNNRDINPRLIRPGQPIVISQNDSQKTLKRKKYYSPTRKLINGQYIVQSGDTLWDIARDFKTSVDKLMKINNLKTAELRPGEKLSIN